MTSTEPSSRSSSHSHRHHHSHSHSHHSHHHNHHHSSSTTSISSNSSSTVTTQSRTTPRQPPPSSISLPPTLPSTPTYPLPDLTKLPRQTRLVFHGTLIHSVSTEVTEYLNDCVVGVERNGVIEFLEVGVEAGKDDEGVKKVLEGKGWRFPGGGRARGGGEGDGVEDADGDGDVEVVYRKLQKGEFLIPGLIDTHTHAPQYPNIGFGQQYELLDWLKKVTFPREKKFENPVYARKTYESVVQRVINSGTTTCCWYGTLHLEATQILADILHERGQRAFVGKCNMDRNSAVDYVEKNASASITDTKEFINHVREKCHSPLIRLSKNPERTSSSKDLTTLTRSSTGSPVPSSSPPRAFPYQNHQHGIPSSGTSTPISPPTSPPLAPTHNITQHSSASSSLSDLPSEINRDGGGGGPNSHSRRKTKNVRSTRHEPTNLVHPILTPRFAISCSDALLASLSALVAQDETLRVQTHLAENPSEIEFTKSLFPFATSYTHVYDHFGLMNSTTILAHCVHLSNEEIGLIKKRNSGISHCPTSNFNLRSGASKVGELLDAGIKVGLGTDVSGGWGLGVLSALRQASVSSKVLRFVARDGRKADGEFGAGDLEGSKIIKAVDHEDDQRDDEGGKEKSSPNGDAKMAEVAVNGLKVDELTEEAEAAIKRGRSMTPKAKKQQQQQQQQQREEIPPEANEGKGDQLMEGTSVEKVARTLDKSKERDGEDFEVSLTRSASRPAKEVKTSGIPNPGRMEAEENTTRTSESVSKTRSETTSLGSGTVESRPEGKIKFADAHLSLEVLFFLATLGGAEVCGLQKRIGNFKVGKEFDALLIQTGQKTTDEVRPKLGPENSDEEVMRSIPDPFPDDLNPALFVEPDDPVEVVFEKFLFTGDDRNIGSVFVRGRCIGGARPIRE